MCKGKVREGIGMAWKDTKGKRRGGLLIHVVRYRCMWVQTRRWLETREHSGSENEAESPIFYFLKKIIITSTHPIVRHLAVNPDLSRDQPDESLGDGTPLHSASKFGLYTR